MPADVISVVATVNIDESSFSNVVTSVGHSASRRKIPMVGC